LALRLDGYIRVSRIGGREGEGYISPAVQREAIEAYARELGGVIVAWHDDQDFSGGNTSRPGFQSMLARLLAGESDGIIVMKIDRFSRSTADGLAIVKEILDRDQVFAACHERIDPKTKEGRYMLRQFLSNAEYFLDQITESWDTAKARAIANGKHIGPTPVGYLKVEPVPSKPTHISPVDAAASGGSTVPGMLVPRPVYGPAITELFVRAATGRYGDTALARWMTEAAAREGGAAWNPSEVRRWLRGRVYLGEVKYGSLVNTDAHAALTTPKLWKRCQREPCEQRRAPSPFLLKGLIRCAACRYAMGGQTNGGADGDTPIYGCRRGSRGCPSPSVIVAKRIEGFVLAEVEARQHGLLLGQFDVDVEDEKAIESFDLAAEEVDTFVADVGARRLMGEITWQEGLRTRVAERERLLPARDTALVRMRSRQLAEISVQDLERHALRDLLAGMIQHVLIRRGGRGAGADERALIIWSDDERTIDFPGPHRAGPYEPVGW